MRITTLVAVVAVGLYVAPASAQSTRVYVSGQFASNSGSRGPVMVGTFPTAGGLIGLRIFDAWSVEFEIDRGFGESDERVSDGLLLSQLDGPGPYSREELEYYGVFARSAWRATVGRGYSAQIVWKSREPGRVNVGLLGGLSWRRFERFHSTEITGLGPGVTYPPGHRAITSSVERWTTTGGGLTAGILVPIHVVRGLMVAPEVRLTAGVITDESNYKALHTGVRVMWGF